MVIVIVMVIVMLMVMVIVMVIVMLEKTHSSFLSFLSGTSGKHR